MNMKYALRSEDTEQMGVIAWCSWKRQQYPELALLHHCPNGGRRNKAEAVKLKQMGVVAGVPDLHLPVPKGIYNGLYIEMKHGEGRLEKEQRTFLKAAAEYGNYCVVCYGAEEAIGIIKDYLSLKSIDTGDGGKPDEDSECKHSKGWKSKSNVKLKGIVKGKEYGKTVL